MGLEILASMDKDQSVTRAEALSLLFEHWSVTAGVESIPVQQALGRVTAQKVYSRNTLPVYRASKMDGIAVRAADFTKGLPDTSNWVKGVDYTQADTGDDFPDGFDAVIAVEFIYYNDKGWLCFAKGLTVNEGQSIRAAGSMVAEGELLIEAHVRLSPMHLGILAMGGIYQVEVIKKPRVVFIPTGSELVTAGVKPMRGQNVESNGLMVGAMLQQWGAEPVCFPVIKDNPAELEYALDLALGAADIVLINGGSSKGAEDFNARLLARRSSFFRHGIKAAPGRPVVIAIIGGKPVINLPGPVNATFLAMDWCVSGMVHHYYGLHAPVRPTVKARLEKPLTKPPAIETFTRLKLTKKGEGYSALPLRMDSSIPQMMLEADALLIAPIGVKGYQMGEEVEVELL